MSGRYAQAWPTPSVPTLLIRRTGLPGAIIACENQLWPASLGRFYTLAIGLAIAGLCLLPMIAAKTASAVALVLIASSVGKGLFDGCIYAAMHDIVPAPARATAVGLMTTLGFIDAGLSPLLVAQVSARYGLTAGMTSLSLAYFAAVVIILAMRRPALRAIRGLGRS